MKPDQILGSPERRAITADDFELRAEGDSLTLTGYASVFENGYDVMGGPDRGGWTETVDPAAFDVTLREKPDLHLLVNHEGLPLARTKSGTLKLSADKVGLKVSADLDRRDPDVERLEVKMDRGDLDEMSFGFRTIRHEFNEEGTERRLLEVSIHKGDVSVVNFGANPATSASIRGLGDALSLLADVDPDTALVEVRSLDDDLVTNALRALQLLRRRDTDTLSVSDARAVLLDS